MGDRFYAQQKAYKPKKVLKKDIVVELQVLLGKEILGLDRLTVKTLNELIEVINANQTHEIHKG